MQAVQPHSLLVPILLGAFIVWRFYSRIRRMVMRQKLSKLRPWITVCVFPILLIVFALSSLAHPLPLAALVGGVAVGTGLGIYGLRLTRFETTPEGMFYTPNAHLGIALSALLIGRIGYRFILNPPSGAWPPQPTLSPANPGSWITLLFFGTLAGYYVTYAIGLIRWVRGTAT
jgi:hypothetical protein